MQAELTIYALRNGMRTLAVRQGHEYIDIYARVLKSASDVAGRTDLDIEGLSQVLLAGIDGLLLAHTVEPDKARTARRFRSLAQVVLHYPLTSGKKPLTPLTLSPAKSDRKRGS